MISIIVTVVVLIRAKIWYGCERGWVGNGASFTATIITRKGACMWTHKVRESEESLQQPPESLEHSYNCN